MTHPPTRRDFLKAGALFAAAAAAPGALARRAFAATRGDSGPNTLVSIFLRGGADPLNVFVPYGDDGYHAARPTLAMTEEDGLVPLDDVFALHPALASWKELWDQGLLAPVVCAGSPHPTRSHFDAQDWMEFAAPGDRTVRDGWLNRYLAATATEDASEFRALAMQELLPRSLRGRYPVLAVPQNLDRRRAGKTLDLFDDFYGDGSDLMEGPSMAGPRDDDDTGVVESGRMTIETLRRFQEIVGKGDRGGRRSARERRRDRERTVAESASAFPSSRFGRRMETIAKVIQADAGLEVVGLDYGGWDDHTNEGATDGRMADRLGDLGPAIAAFCRALGPRMERTTIVLMSEFGRTVRENGNDGTDHGHGGAMVVIGGGVKGGRIHGDWRGLASSALYQGRDLPVTTDFRDVQAAVLENVLGFDLPKGFFPGYQPRPVAKLF